MTWPKSKFVPSQRATIVAGVAAVILLNPSSSSNVGGWLGLDGMDRYDPSKVRRVVTKWLAGKDSAAVLLTYLHLTAGNDLHPGCVPLYDALSACGYVASDLEVERVYGATEDPDADAK